MLEYSIADRIKVLKNLNKVEFPEYKTKIRHLKKANPKTLRNFNLKFFSDKIKINESVLNKLLLTDNFLQELSIFIIDKSLLNDE